MKTFNVPIIYRSPLITAIKNKRKLDDKLKKDFSPTLLDFGPLKIFLARHFGFCYGVENAIEIAFRTIEENPEKRIFLLSEMIHNPQVNADLRARGVEFLQDTSGETLIPFDHLQTGDIVIIPAFGTTVEIEKELFDLGISTRKYDTTCPFVEKVWKRSEQIALRNYSVVIHGKPNHEETRATFSHTALHAPAVVVRDLEQATLLASYIRRPSDTFYEDFKGQFSAGFDVYSHLQKIGVVNQTTMLASDTQQIADLLKRAVESRHQFDNPGPDVYFADTRDTLCYATNDNQSAVIRLLQTEADLALVVGGYNSSNTTHLVELCQDCLPTFFVNTEEKIISRTQILHYDIRTRQETMTADYLPDRTEVRILMTGGASCPDALVEGVIEKLLSFFPTAYAKQTQIARFS